MRITIRATIEEMEEHVKSICDGLGSEAFGQWRKKNQERIMKGNATEREKRIYYGEWNRRPIEYWHQLNDDDKQLVFLDIYPHLWWSMQELEKDFKHLLNGVRNLGRKAGERTKLTDEMIKDILAMRGQKKVVARLQEKFGKDKLSKATIYRVLKQHSRG